MPTAPSHRRAAGATLATLVLVASFAGADAAAADPIADKRAEAAEVAERLDRLEVDAEVLTEDYNDARLALTEARARTKRAQRRADKAAAKVEQRKGEVADFAIGVYVSGGTTDATPEILEGNFGEAARKQGYAEATVGDKVELVGRLRAARVEADRRAEALSTSQARAERARRDVEAKKRDAERAVAAQTATVARVEGELTDLVRQEEERRAAAARRRAEAEQRRAAEAAERRAEAQRQADVERRATRRFRRPAPATAPTAASATPSSAASRPAATPPSGPSAASSRPAPAPAPARAPVPAPASGGAGAAIAAGRSVLGVPYRWAGASPSTGFDCSGFVMWAWAKGGKSLPHSSRAMYAMATKISMSSLQPGDLVFYGQPSLHHVAIYIGGGQIIHSPSSGSTVRIDSVNYWDELVGAGRI